MGKIITQSLFVKNSILTMTCSCFSHLTCRMMSTGHGHASWHLRAGKLTNIGRITRCIKEEQRFQSKLATFMIVWSLELFIELQLKDVTQFQYMKYGVHIEYMPCMSFTHHKVAFSNAPDHMESLSTFSCNIWVILRLYPDDTRAGIWCSGHGCSLRSSVLHGFDMFK
jgi:hypothetical protein